MQGFYSIYRTLFALLASDEELHTPEDRRPLAYPTFGSSSTPYAPPPGTTRKQREGQDYVRDFYVVWSEFSTEKRFEWIEEYESERGEDRRIRRAMEKENRKIREEHRKEYIDTVKVRGVQAGHKA